MVEAIALAVERIFIGFLIGLYAGFIGWSYMNQSASENIKPCYCIGTGVDK